MHDVTGAFSGSGFRVFDSIADEVGAVVAMVVPGWGDTGRGKLDKLDKDVVRHKLKGGGLFHFRLPTDGSGVQSSVKEEALPLSFVQKAIDQTGASTGDLVLVIAGPSPKVFEQMGSLRLHMATEM